MAEIVRVEPDDWEEMRAVRLASLSESPGAFGSTTEREVAFAEADWRARLASPSFVARADGSTVGMVGAFHPPGEPDPMLVSMWVAPGYRGRGVADGLVEAVVGWARQDGHERIVLWVVEDNGRARRFYARLGFLETGRTQPLPRNASVLEIEMVRPLA